MNFTSSWIILGLIAFASAPALRAQANYVTPYVLTPFAGDSSIGSADGQGAAARFYYPGGIATDAAGNIYVGDTSNQTIRRITPAGLVTTLAGKPGVHGGVSGENGTGDVARFADPIGLTVDRAGNVYVADFNGYDIRKITPAGLVSTIAEISSGGEWPDHPRGITGDAAGNIFYTDWSRQIVTKLSPAGVLTKVAGRTLMPGNTDGQGDNAQFSNPTGIAADAMGNLYVSQWDRIRKVTPNGTVTTLPTIEGITNSYSNGLTMDAAGNLIVAASFMSVIAKIAPDGTSAIIAGAMRDPGYQDGTAAAARFLNPQAVAVDPAGNFFVADGNNVVRKISPNGQVSTLAGLPLSEADGTADGVGPAARFSAICFVALTPGGDLLVADTANHTIRKISPAGVVTTLAGSAGLAGLVDGSGGAARFDNLSLIATDGSGNAYVVDRTATTASVIRKIAPAGVVTTLPSTGVYYPRSLVVDAGGNVFYSEYHSIQRLGTDGQVSTYAGLRASNPADSFYGAGSEDGPRGTARFYNPAGLALDAGGNLYVADSYNSTIRKITPDGTTSTIAGTARSYGFADGPRATARFAEPSALALDGAGNLYIADRPADVIRKLAPDGTVTTLAGLASAPGHAPGIGAEARLHWPQSIAATPTGTLYVPNFNQIFKGQPAAAPAITRQPQSLSVTTGSSVQLSIAAEGAPAPTYQWHFNGSPFSGATSATLGFANARATDAGDYTVVVTNSLGNITSAKATLTVTTAPAPPAPSSGGGGAPSGWFLFALVSTGLARRRWHPLR